MRVRHWPVVLLVVLLALTASASAAQARTYSTNCNFHLRYKPRTMIFPCADYGLFAKRIRWYHWGTLTARADPALLLQRLHSLLRRRTLPPPDRAASPVACEVLLLLRRGHLHPRDGDPPGQRLEWPAQVQAKAAVPSVLPTPVARQRQDGRACPGSGRR